MVFESCGSKMVAESSKVEAEQAPVRRNSSPRLQKTIPATKSAGKKKGNGKITPKNERTLTLEKKEKNKDVSASKNERNISSPTSVNKKSVQEKNSARPKRQIDEQSPSGSNKDTSSKVSQNRVSERQKSKGKTKVSDSESPKSESSRVKDDGNKKSIKSSPISELEDSGDDFSAIEKKIFEGVERRDDNKARKTLSKKDSSDQRERKVRFGKDVKSPERKCEGLDKRKETIKKHNSSKSPNKEKGTVKKHEGKSKESQGRNKEHEKDKSKKSLEKSCPNENKRKESKEKNRNKNSKTQSSSQRNQNNDRRKNAKKREQSDSKKKIRGQKKPKLDSTASESDLSDWEEVEEEEEHEAKTLLEEYGALSTKEESVKIELDAPDVMWGMKKRKRKTEDEMIEEYLRRSVNRSIREVYENMHKTHLLCLLAHGRHLNKSLNSEVLLGSALSLIVDKNAYPPQRLDLGYLQKFSSWFCRKITMVGGELPSDYWSQDLDKVLGGRFESKSARTNRELVLMFVIFCRALGINARLVLSLQPLSWRPRMSVLIRKSQGENEESLSKKLREPWKSESPMPSTSQASTSKKPQMDRKTHSLDPEDFPSTPPKKKKKKVKEDKGSSLSEDGDFEPEKAMNVPKPIQSQKKRKSKDEDEEKKKKKKSEPLVEWAEVYVEEEEKWVCVDITHNKIHCIAEIEARMPSTSGYITAFNVALGVRDVTRRYVSSWLSSKNKLRCDSEWWGVAIKAFRGTMHRIDREEERELDLTLTLAPLPKNIGEYKNHPLYCLQRHLLKFEALYPPNVTPVGFIKGETVYPRECIKKLHSRETWLKEAKSVRIGEEPYKIVKARPKWDRNLCQMIKDRPLELYGDWQIEDYEPPIAVNGKVPRNDYGNVELYKPCMLPRGCVHLPISGLAKTARKLGIDCAPAMVGFDLHSGMTHPIFDGFIVCEEFKDVLIDAWNEDEAERVKRAEAKREKRIYDNWKKLIKGMIIKTRVREEYKRDDSDEEDTKTKIEDTEDTQEPKDTRKKITQDDIDALRPDTDQNRDEGETKKPLITHTVKNLKIDLSSNVVEMAKKSRQRTMKTKNSVKKQPVKKTKKKMEVKERKIETGTLSEDSETDEEEKKEKIRAILNWGTDHISANPELSDDSDADNKPKASLTSSYSFTANPELSEDSDADSKPQESLTSPNCFTGFPDSNPFFSSIISPAINKAKRSKRKVSHPKSELSDESSESDASSRSTTPEPDVKELYDVPAAPRRLASRRNLSKKKTTNYAESESDISLDSSDCDDRTYNPAKEKEIS